jgi:Tol biopolymer transport system component
MDLAPYVDPDEDYIIFESTRPGGVGGVDLYISFQTAAGTWTNAVNLGSAVNSTRNEGGPFVSADGLYLFFNSDRVAHHERDPYWVDAQVIEVLRLAQ